MLEQTFKLSEFCDLGDHVLQELMRNRERFEKKAAAFKRIEGSSVADFWGQSQIRLKANRKSPNKSFQ